MAKDPHDPGTLDLFGDTPAAGTAASQRGGTQMRRFSEMNAGRFIRAADYEPGERFLVIIVQVYEDELLAGAATRS